MIGWITTAQLSEEGDPPTPKVSSKALINLAVLALSDISLPFLPTIQHPSHDYSTRFLTLNYTSDLSNFKIKSFPK